MSELKPVLDQPWPDGYVIRATVPPSQAELIVISDTDHLRSAPSIREMVRTMEPDARTVIIHEAVGYHGDQDAPPNMQASSFQRGSWEDPGSYSLGCLALEQALACRTDPDKLGDAAIAVMVVLDSSEMRNQALLESCQAAVESIRDPESRVERAIVIAGSHHVDSLLEPLDEGGSDFVT